MKSDVLVFGLLALIVITGCVTSIFATPPTNQEIEKKLENKVIWVKFEDGQVVEKKVQNFRILE